GQLREREAGRFLRRRGPTPAGGPAPAGGGARPQRSRSSESSSPYAGGQVSIDMPITVKKLSDKLSVKSSELITTAIRTPGLDIFRVNINSLLDEDTAALLAHEFGVELQISKTIEAEEALITDLKKKRKGVEDEHLTLRPPTVAFLGHVDHGKTTLIDAIRNSRVAESEVLELKCHPEGPAQGVVLEAEIQQGKGIVAHLLVQDGTLNRGDIILAGEGYGKVRSMHDDRGNTLEHAPPSMPVEVSGLSA